MTMIPAAVPAAPAAPAGPASPPAAGGELATAFAALVSALNAQLVSGEQAPTEEGATPQTGTEVAPADAEVEVADGADDAAAIVAALLAGAAPPAAVAAEGSSAGDAPAADGEAPAPALTGRRADGTGGSVEVEGNVEGTVEGTVEGEVADATIETDAADETAQLTEADAAVDEAVPGADEATEGESTEPTVDDAVDPVPEADTDPGSEPVLDTEPPAPEDGATAPADGPDAAAVTAPASAAGATSAASEGATATVAAPTAAAAVDGTATGTAPARPAGAAPALADQLVTVLTPLRRGPDGTHRLSMQLRPDELGEVLIDVRVRGNEITLNLRADLAGTADLLRASLAELRADLEEAGFHAGDLDVSEHAADGGVDDRTDGGAGPAGERSHADGDETAPDPERTAPRPMNAAAGLDLRL